MGMVSLSPLKRALVEIRELRDELEFEKRKHKEPIAIIGIGCRFPGNANGPESFWEILREGADAISEVPPSRWAIDVLCDENHDRPGKMNSRFGGFIEPLDTFDASFFGISPREATTMDPQQRLVLELGWEALEHAALPSDMLNGSLTGVFIGIGSSDYCLLRSKYAGLRSIDSYVTTGSVSHSVAAGRLSYSLGFQGPAIAVDTACSSSLVAVHLACQSLRNKECDLALAGGVNAILDPENSISLSKSGLIARDGRCKVFDQGADGFARAEGGGIVVLKRLSDALSGNDPILALIKGSAVNQDGRSNGLTAPNGPSQKAVILAALANAGVDSERISYIEAHGTGTVLGDPIEVRALGEVYGRGRDQADYPYIGSVKTNIGHAEAAAGVAGLIKVVLALQNRLIPPHLHFKHPNPHIPWDKFPFKIPTRPTPWECGKERRLGAVSSFGFSGTNAHIIIEEAPDPDLEVRSRDRERPIHPLCLSAKSKTALDQSAARHAVYLDRNPDAPLADVCYTANARRSHFPYRLFVRGESHDAISRKLKDYCAGISAPDTISALAKDSPPRLAFLFTGQGPQYTEMGRDLYETSPVFRDALERSNEILAPVLGFPLLSVIYPRPSVELSLDQTAYAQPALFALEYALARLWASWGIRPIAVMGHGLGEYVAACVAGAFSLEDGLRLVAERGRMIQSLPAGGVMATVFADLTQVMKVVEAQGGSVSVAAVNGPNNTVLSGPQAEISVVLAALEAEGMEHQYLTASHAFHSDLLEPVLDRFERAASEVAYMPPQIDLVSNLTGRLVGPEQFEDPGYWRRHMRSPVQFEAGVHALQARGVEVFVEIGPHPVLLTLARGCLPADYGTWLPSLRRERRDWDQLLESLGHLYLQGILPDWPGFDAPYRRKALALPTYPFEKERYWFDEDKSSSAGELRKISWEAVTDAGRRQSGQVPIELNLQSYPEKWRILEQYATAVMMMLLKSMNVFSDTNTPISVDAILSKMDIAPVYRPVIDRWLSTLSRQNKIKAGNGGFYVDVPVLESEVDELDSAARNTLADIPFLYTYISSCARALKDILAGRTNPLDMLFPGGSCELAEDLYRNWPLSSYFNAIASEVLRAIVEALPRSATLRILEIGAGTGGMTSAMVPMLREERSVYYFTDVSEYFLKLAEQRFGSYPFMRYGLLDIEKDPLEQGYGQHQFDIIVAANVLHATKDLRCTLANVSSLLAPGGVLIMLETTFHPPWFDISFGLIEGWQRFEDSLRKGHPLLKADEWVRLLKDSGFDSTGVFPGHPDGEANHNEQSYARGIFFQNLIIARRPFRNGCEDNDASIFNIQAKSFRSIEGNGYTNKKESKETGSQWLQVLNSSIPQRRLDTMVDFVKEKVCAVLRRDPLKPLNRRDRLMDLGLDSLMAVQLRNQIEKALGLSKVLPATLAFDYPTCEAVATFLLSDILHMEFIHEEPVSSGTSSSREQEAGGSSADASYEKIKDLTDAEVEQLMREKLSKM
jgi:acyl transferase domain-containing protein/SAM-dependent methyltransferase/acyl carrier protein